MQKRLLLVTTVLKTFFQNKQSFLIYIEFWKHVAKKFEDFKLLWILTNNWHESLKERAINAVLHVNRRCHYSAEPPTLHTYLTVPKS
jgi:hypothetical protein